jgi:hypothetical protein
MLVFGASFVGLMLLPVDFPYYAFAALIMMTGIGTGMFAAPNTSAIMSSVEPVRRGVASGMRSTLQNAGNLLSIGTFFSLMIAGLSRHLPSALTAGLEQNGVPQQAARQAASVPPVSSLFAAFLGVNPTTHLLPAGVVAALPPAHRAVIEGDRFFPTVLATPFHDGLIVAFTVSAILAVTAAVASLLRGRRPPRFADPSSERTTS